MSGHAFLPTSERLAVIAERSEVGVQNTARVWNGCLPCIRECVTSWQFKQWSRFSLSAVVRVDDKSRPLQRGGSSVWMGMQTT